MKTKLYRPLKTIILMLGIGTIVAGCSTHPVAVTQKGAIDAYIHGEYPIDKIATNPPACLQDLPVTQLMTKRFVALSYRPSSSKYRTFTIAEAPSSELMQAGMHVEVIPGDCQKGGLATIIRPLYTHAPL